MSNLSRIRGLLVGVTLLGASTPALALEITTGSLSGATAGVPYSDVVVAANGTTPYTWSIDSGTLPAGIALDAGTGGLSGTATLAGTGFVVVKVEDAVGDTATKALSVTVSAGAAAALAFDQEPGAIVAGAAFNPVLAVSVRDAFGNLVSDATDAVTLQLSSGSGALVGTSTVAASGGIATFPGLTVEVAGSKQIGASSGSLTPATSASFSVTAGAPASLAFVQQPSNAAAGATITPAVTVRVSDGFGNGVAGETVALSLVGTGTLTGGAGVTTDGSGLATFAGLSVNLTGSKQLSASSGSLTPATSASFSVTAGAAASLAFVQQPSDANTGATIAPAVTVRVVDGSGNGVPGETVTLSLVGTGTLSGGAGTTTDGSGLATFAALSVNLAGSKQLTAGSGSLTPATSASFTISCPIITLSPSSLPQGASGVAYAQTISAAGGGGPFSFTVSSGALPSGLTLASSGLLSGTPATSGSFSFTIDATDPNACVGSRGYSLFICPAISVLPSSVPDASIGVAYSQTFTASAGSAPFTFAVTAGALPAGLSLSSSGVLSGTPTVVGTFGFTIGVTAAGGCTGSAVDSIRVFGIPSAVTDLAATRVTSGNDADGTTKISITFTMPAGGTVAEVYRAPFGHYPQYDDAGGSVPATPAYPPGAPWSLTGVTASGQTDEPATRDFYYYVAFVRNSGGGVSSISNKTSGTCNYALGDVSNGLVAGTGNNLVGPEDVSLLGANYGIGAALIASRGVAYLDIGPTTDLAITSRPFTDKRIDFEDLIVLATNYGVVSSQQLAARLADEAGHQAAGLEELQVQAPSLVERGQTLTATLHLKSAGRMQGFSAALTWDADVVEPVESVSGGFIEAQGGVVLPPELGTIDAALLGIRAPGISGEGDVARVTFRALRQGDARIGLGRVVARDAANRPVLMAQTAQAERPAHTLLLAPWPNPTPGTAMLAFALAEPGMVELALYSVDGRRVRTLVNGHLDAGVHRERWIGDDDQGRPVPAGVYYLHLTVGGRRFTKSIVHLK